MGVASARSPLNRLRRACLALPDAWERCPTASPRSGSARRCSRPSRAKRRTENRFGVRGWGFSLRGSRSRFTVHGSLRHCDGVRQVRPSAGRVRLSSVNRWAITPRASGPVTTTRSPGFRARIRSWPVFPFPHSTAHSCLAAPAIRHPQLDAGEARRDGPADAGDVSLDAHCRRWSRRLAGSGLATAANRPWRYDSKA